MISFLPSLELALPIGQCASSLMRRIILRTLLILVCLGAIGLGWILGGRQMTLLVDRIGTVVIERIPITELSCEGAQTGGTFRLGSRMLSITGPDNHPVPLSIVPDENNKLVLFASGKSVPLGDLVPASTQEPGATFTVRPDQGDEAFLTVRRSFLSWPTPLDFNFMTGHAPSWKRHRYYYLSWKKRSGSELNMLWRYEQYFYPSEGWTAGEMTREGTTGLIKAEISP
ncbi:MAG TPA: hypothetical protein VK581_04765 [Chthoniobacterales bacterium]|nr:hypothetical protein [Chthoniobacterales bacterium]